MTKQMIPRRAHLRAPLKSFLLYEDDSYVFKARTLNISEGGILIEQLPNLPVQSIISIMISLVDIPVLHNITWSEIKRISKKNFLPEMFFEREIIRARSKIVRSFKDKSSVDNVFIQKIGCSFIEMPLESRKRIRKYVSIFTKNIVFLLGLFESVNNKDSNIEIIRSLAHILGYRKDEKISILRQQVLHDYQSLDSL